MMIKEIAGQIIKEKLSEVSPKTEGFVSDKIDAKIFLGEFIPPQKEIPVFSNIEKKGNFGEKDFALPLDREVPKFTDLSARNISKEAKQLNLDEKSANQDSSFSPESISEPSDIDSKFNDSQKSKETMPEAESSLDSELSKSLEINTEDVHEKPQIVQNKENGCRREETVQKELESRYPEKDGYKVLRERDLLDENGIPVKDPTPGEGKQAEGRRIDFVVVHEKNGAVDSIEVTSETAPKEEQIAKEQRIKDAGGTFVRDPDTGKLYDISKVDTRIERRA